MEWKARRAIRWLTFAGLLMGSCCASVAHAECRLTGDPPGALELALSPVRIAVPKDAPDGALLGSAQAAALRDIPFTCTGTDNLRELSVLAPADVTSGLGDVYATNLAGIGFRIVTRGGSFAGIDDGPRTGAYQVKLPPDADRLTGFDVRVDFVKIGDGQGGTLAPGKLASVTAGGAALVDVVVPDGGVSFDAQQCAPLSVGGEVSAGGGTMGAFSQEAVVIQTGCSSGVNVALGLESTYVYGAKSPLVVDPPPPPVKHAAADIPPKAGFIVQRRSNGNGNGNGNGNSVWPPRPKDQKPDADDGNNAQSSTGATGSSSGTGYGVAGNSWNGFSPRH
jgi:hypothetical protein